MDPISGIFIGAGVGAVLNELCVETRNITSILIHSKSTCKDVKEIIDRLKPTIDELSKLSTDPSSHRDEHFRKFQSQLHDGLQVVNKMEKIGNFNLFRKYSYAKKILKLEKNVKDFMLTQGIADIMLGVQKLNVSLEEMGRRIIENVNARMTSNPDSNSLMLQQISTEDDTNRQDSAGCSAQVPDLTDFVVGLSNLINDAKRSLFQVDVDIVGIKGMPGSGKTTLALALKHSHNTSAEG